MTCASRIVISALSACVGFVLGAVVGLATWELAFGAFRRQGRA